VLVPVDRASGTSKLRLGPLLDENAERNFCLNHFLGNCLLFWGVDMARGRLRICYRRYRWKAAASNDVPWFYQGSTSELAAIDHARFYMCLHRRPSASHLSSNLSKYVSCICHSFNLPITSTVYMRLREMSVVIVGR
jgi:hypothetical protein